MSLIEAVTDGEIWTRRLRRLGRFLFSFVVVRAYVDRVCGSCVKHVDSMYRLLPCKTVAVTTVPTPWCVPEDSKRFDSTEG